MRQFFSNPSVEIKAYIAEVDLFLPRMNKNIKHLKPLTDNDRALAKQNLSHEVEVDFSRLKDGLYALKTGKSLASKDFLCVWIEVFNGTPVAEYTNLSEVREMIVSQALPNLPILEGRDRDVRNANSNRFRAFQFLAGAGYWQKDGTRVKQLYALPTAATWWLVADLALIDNIRQHISEMSEIS